MNKTVTINIAGLVFHIDEDAYNKLDSYIQAVRNSIQQESEDEIIADIESRIAELFAERIDPQTGVIRMNNVDEIINIMGKPEDYIIEDEPIKPNNFTTTNKNYKKIYRDGEKRILGGVCSGLAHYFNIDPVWMRIIFLLLLFLYGTSMLIYFILWIIIPKARSVSEILEMKGEPVNISNIEKQFREGFSASYQTLKNNGKSAADVIRKVFGVALIVFSVISIFGSFFAPIAFNAQREFIFNNILTYDEAQIGIPFWGLNLSLFLTSCIPFVVLLLCGIKILKPKTKHIGLVSAILGFIWLVAVFVFSYVMINLNLEKEKIESLFEENFETKISKANIILNNNDTLNVIFQRDPRVFTINDTISGTLKYSEVDDIDVEILESTTGNAFIEIEEKIFNDKKITFTGYGLTKHNVKIEQSKNSNTLNYNYSIKSDTLVLSNAILTTLNDFTEDSKVRIKLYITENQYIKINSNDNRYFWNQQIDEGKHYYKFNNAGILQNTNNTIN
ncbi:PspC domain-containing protein [Flavobacterium dauae]|uniref:PspC domain-containing protein n=1 Tax=Flavobacterium dauae TaxID=1563479 RepID=UPI00101B3855|nr:PspC domain-containing protein [Flavobacterium dauae]WLD24674.1 PspC domain-containing protein [Flavobacterium dauae]